MYPTLYHAVLDLFGVSVPAFKIVMMFGFFVALAFLAASWVITLEFKRLEKDGVLKSVQKKVEKPNLIRELITNGLVGFLIGFKIIHLGLNFSDLSDNPQAFLISSEGSWLWGIVMLCSFAGYRYYQYVKEGELDPNQTVKYHPYMIVSNLTFIAALAGFTGAKLFHHLEYYEELFADPMVLFRDPFSGLTFFGGLIGGTIGVLWYAGKNGVPWKRMIDLGGPALMLAYGIGRMGCHVSGDGDWGVENLAPKPNWLNWLPDWAWAYNYEGNVHGITLENPVWPTPFYEVLMALSLFFILWSIRKRFAPGVLFCIYLIFAGVERFLIEKIRVNPDYHFLGLDFTQAEMISFSFVLLGTIGIFIFSRGTNKTAEH